MIAELFRKYQLDMMLILIGVCGITAVFVFITGTLSKQRKKALMLVEIYSMILLIADRLSYIYEGDVSTLGYWMARISNFLLFFMTLAVIHAINRFITDLLMNEGGFDKVPKSLIICESLVGVGELMVVISQFTGLYYTFDADNHYVRAPGYMFSYLVPAIVMILQMLILFRNRSCLRPTIRYPLMLFAVVPVIASVAQIFLFGLSLINMSIVGMAVVLFASVLIDMNVTVLKSHRIELESLKNQQRSMHRLFEQTATALASAIDAKDEYTHGHSSRVAEYSKKIAEMSGKGEEESEEIYFSALLHDVGKIGVPDEIINKAGKLTDEEFKAIKEHPKIGDNILSSISEYPYLSIAARYHHERFDGKGYPDHLKGDDIPELARIVAVADAYDAMTSKRSYRDSIPQSKVREEIIKGSGSQFDPVFARIMQHLIDLDSEFKLREREEIKSLNEREGLSCIEYKDTISDGILITDTITSIRMKYSPELVDPSERSVAALLLFDSNDGRAYSNERKRKELHYFEYGEITFDGHTVISGARDMQITTDEASEKSAKHTDRSESADYIIEAARYKDHAVIRIRGGIKPFKVTVALPDSSRFLYLGLTGKYCRIENIRIDKSGEVIGEGYIQRIAEEISYINVPAGDIPNVQIDGYRMDATPGIEIKDGLSITFHSMSLPTANLIWHCPYISIFYSKDKKVRGEGFREFALIRIDGEYWEPDDAGKNEMHVSKDDSFEGWDSWKELNKGGIDCTVTFSRKDNIITTVTENLGIYIENITTITDGTVEIYAALSGDQCALTNIRIS